jgi:hypothetical protein
MRIHNPRFNKFAKLEEFSCVFMPEWWWAEAAPEVLEGWK